MELTKGQFITVNVCYLGQNRRSVIVQNLSKRQGKLKDPFFDNSSMST